MKTKTKKVYKKADSISRIRADSLKQKRVFDRIRQLQNRLDQQQVNMNKRKQTVKKACNGLLDSNETSEFVLRNHVVEEIDRLHDGELERYLYYRYRYEIYPTKHTADSHPPCVQIEPTSICNFRCVFCFQTDKKFANKKSMYMGTMSIDLFKNTIDQLEGEVEAITLASRGEPLLASKFSEMLNYLSGKFLAVKVNTNASLLNERISHAILESDIQTLVFSVDASSEPLYSKLRVNGNLERIVKNIRRFIDIKRKYYPKSRLITRASGVFYSADQDIIEMEKIWGRWVDQVVFVDYNPWENVYNSPINQITTPCSDLWRRLFVWWDGRINPCDVDYMSTLSPGTIENQTISEIWRGEIYENLRQQHLAGLRQKFHPCMSCSFV